VSTQDLYGPAIRQTTPKHSPPPGRTPNSGMWNSARWDRAVLPTSDHKRRPVEYHLGTQCRSRAQLYHALTHFKYRLIERVRTKLREHGGSVNALVVDDEFVSEEYRRFVEIRGHLDAQVSRGGKSGSRIQLSPDWSLWPSDGDGDEESDGRAGFDEEESDFE